MIIFLLFIQSLLFSQNFENKFQEANKFYQSEDYKNAINLYNNLLEENIKSADLHFNLGNAYFRNDQIGLAILHYNKSLKIDPNNEDAKFNLEIAKLKTIDKFDQIPTFFLYDIEKSISSLFNEKAWTILNIILVFVLLTLIIGFRINKRKSTKKVILLSLIVNLFFIIFSSYFGYKQYKYESNLTNGVIISQSSYVKSSPDENSQDLLILHEGTSFEVLDKVNNWIEVKLTDGNKGWVKLSEIERF